MITWAWLVPAMRKCHGRQGHALLKGKMMSELTSCNYCNLQAIRINKPKGSRVITRPGSMGWIDVYVVPKGEKLDTARDKKGNHITSQFRASFMVLTDHCVC